MRNTVKIVLVVLFVMGSFISARGELNFLPYEGSVYGRMDTVGMARSYITINCYSLKNPAKDKELLEFCANAYIIEADRVKKGKEIKKLQGCMKDLDSSSCPAYSMCVRGLITLEQYNAAMKLDELAECRRVCKQ